MQYVVSVLTAFPARALLISSPELICKADEVIPLTAVLKELARIITPKIENESYIFEVDCKRKSGTYLTIFLNNTSIITYKIK